MEEISSTVLNNYSEKTQDYGDEVTNSNNDN